VFASDLVDEYPRRRSTCRREQVLKGDFRPRYNLKCSGRPSDGWLRECEYEVENDEMQQPAT